MNLVGIGKWLLCLGLGGPLFVWTFAGLWEFEFKPSGSRLFVNAPVIGDARGLSDHPNALIALTGKVRASSKLTDKEFLNRNVTAAALQRNVEVYSWTESPKAVTGPDGKSTFEVEYIAGWSEKPANSKRFKDKRYKNKKPKVNNRSWKASRFEIGGVSFSSKGLTLPEKKKIRIKKGLLSKKARKRYRAVDGRIYPKTADAANPKIGDYRIYYSINPRTEVMTLFAASRRVSVMPFVRERTDQPIYELRSGNPAVATAGEREWFWFKAWGPRAGYWLALSVSIYLVAVAISGIMGWIPLLGYALASTGIRQALVLGGLGTSVLVLSAQTQERWMDAGYALGALLVLYIVVRGIRREAYIKTNMNFTTEHKKKLKALADRKQRNQIIKYEEDTELIHGFDAETAELSIQRAIYRFSTSRVNIAQNESVCWFVKIRDRWRGPFSIEKLNRYLDEGKVRPDSIAQKIGTEEQLEVSQIPGIQKKAA